MNEYLPSLEKIMRTKVIAIASITMLSAAAARHLQAQPTLPDFSAATFSSPLNIDNPYFPLAPGKTYTYDVLNTDPDTGETESEVILVQVLNQTRLVAGVETQVVRDRVWLEGLLIEDTFDWYAQDDAGNVWYLGEEVTNFEYDDQGSLLGTTNEGAWETGVDGAQPGYIMPANPQVGDHYFNEFYPGEAEDHSEVVGLGETHTIPLASFDGVLHTRDFSLSFESYGEKFYAPGVGTVMEQDFDIGGNLLGVTTLRSVTNVPEPATMMLLALGSMALVAAARGNSN